MKSRKAIGEEEKAVAKQIELQFLNEENRTVTISLEDPIEPVNPAAVHAAMDAVIAGGDLVGKKGARIVERTVTEIELE